MKAKLLFLGLLILFSCESTESPWCILEGNVFYKDGTPAVNVQVSLPGYGMCSTDKAGYFRFSNNLIKGEYTLTVFVSSNPFYKEKVILETGQKLNLQIAIPSPNLPEINVVDIHLESEWEYFVAGKEEYFFINVKNSLPETVFYHSFKQNKNYLIYFNEKGLPTKVVADNYIFLFDNFKGKKVDFAIVSPSGEIQIIREASSSFNWDTDLNPTKSTANIIKWVGRALGAIPCITTGAAALVSGGAAIPLALWTCGNYLLKITAGFVEDQGVHNGFTDFVNFHSMFSTVYNCTAGITNPTSCLTTFAMGALREWADNADELKANENVRLAGVSLHAGYGDIQVTLIWNNVCDLDLYVIDPLGEEVSYRNPYSASGGILDIDDMDGYGPENIYWPKLTAPVGIYKVLVKNVGWVGRPSSANFIVTIVASGKTKRFSGTVGLGNEAIVTTFDKNNF